MIRWWEAAIFCAIMFCTGYVVGQLKQHNVTLQWKTRTHSLARVGMRHTIVYHPEHTDMVEYYYDIAKEANLGRE